VRDPLLLTSENAIGADCALRGSRPQPVEEPVREAPEQLAADVPVDQGSGLRVSLYGFQGRSYGFEEFVSQALPTSFVPPPGIFDVGRSSRAEDGRLHRRARSCLSTSSHGTPRGRPFAASWSSASDRRSNSAC